MARTPTEGTVSGPLAFLIRPQRQLLFSVPFGITGFSTYSIRSCQNCSCYGDIRYRTRSDRRSGAGLILLAAAEHAGSATALATTRHAPGGRRPAHDIAPDNRHYPIDSTKASPAPSAVIQKCVFLLTTFKNISRQTYKFTNILVLNHPD